MIKAQVINGRFFFFFFFLRDYFFKGGFIFQWGEGVILQYGVGNPEKHLVNISNNYFSSADTANAIILYSFSLLTVRK